MIQLFYCSNSMTESEARKLATRFGEDDLKMLGLPCSGKITIPYLVKAFESGADGVVLCGCRPEDCRNLEGVLRAFKRGQAVEDLMEEVGLGKNRVLSISKSQGNLDEVVMKIKQFQNRLQTTTVRATGPRTESIVGTPTPRENAA
ncbi:MAG TPA: hydrogenase iron-sulfur subunit [Sedimentisphaerales bacterium]|nr:hydrogenase iron-sulfur subunit [Sedimentisphaerales bacterium]